MTPTSNRLPLALSLVIALSLVAAAAATAQTPVTLERVGDVIPGMGHVTSFGTFRVNGGGDWILEVETDHPNPDRNEALLRNGGIMVREGNPAPGLGGATFSHFSDFDVNDAGDSALCARVETLAAGEKRVLFYKGQPLLVEGDAVGSGGFAAGSTYTNFSNVHLNDSNQLLVVATVLEATDYIDALMRYEVDAMGNLVSETLLTREGDVPAGQGFPIASLYSAARSYSLNDNGGGVWSAILDQASLPYRDIMYYNSANLIAQTATPSPIPGRDWADFFLSPPCDSNSSGSWVIQSKLDSSDLTNDGIILVDGAVYLREGDPSLTFPGNDVLDLGDGSVFLTESGEVVYYAQVDGFASSSDEGLFLGHKIVAREGTTQTFDGQWVTTIHQEYYASDDGDFLMYRATLDGIDEAVLLVERNIGVDYCSAEPNSTGGESFIVPSGSTDVSFNSLRLWTYNMPADQFGYYMASMTQGDVLHPGGSQGRLCLGGTIGRFVLQVQNSGPAGNFNIDVDLTAIPLTPAVPVQPGETWNLQTWHRDNNPNPTSNFSLPVSITFR